jgi:small multidrug resistance family-3 protein
MSAAAASALYFATALAEIAGCYAVYAWLRMGKPIWWLVPGIAGLLLFAWMLTLHTGPAGRIYAAYGAVYIAASIAWMWVVERQRPDMWDVSGTVVCLVGAGIIYFGPRS